MTTDTGITGPVPGADGAAPVPHGTDRALDEAFREAEAHIVRADSKAGTLLGLGSVVLTGLTTLVTLGGDRLPATAQAGIGGALLALLVGIVLLGRVLRANLGSRGRPVREGYIVWARMSREEFLAALCRDDRATRAIALSAIAVAKYRRINIALLWLFTALVLLAAAAVAAFTR